MGKQSPKGAVDACDESVRVRQAGGDVGASEPRERGGGPAVSGVGSIGGSR